MLYHYSAPDEDQLMRAANASIYEDMRHFNTELSADEAGKECVRNFYVIKPRGVPKKYSPFHERSEYRSVARGLPQFFF